MINYEIIFLSFMFFIYGCLIFNQKRLFLVEANIFMMELDRNPSYLCKVYNMDHYESRRRFVSDDEEKEGKLFLMSDYRVEKAS